MNRNQLNRIKRGHIFRMNQFFLAVFRCVDIIIGSYDLIMEEEISIFSSKNLDFIYYNTNVGCKKSSEGLRTLTPILWNVNRYFKEPT